MLVLTGRQVAGMVVGLVLFVLLASEGWLLLNLLRQNGRLLRQGLLAVGVLRVQVAFTEQQGQGSGSPPVYVRGGSGQGAMP